MQEMGLEPIILTAKSLVKSMVWQFHDKIHDKILYIRIEISKSVIHNMLLFFYFFINRGMPVDCLHDVRGGPAAKL